LGYKRKEENEKIFLKELNGKNNISETSSYTKRISLKNEVNGYDLLKLPSPSPSKHFLISNLNLISYF